MATESNGIRQFTIDLRLTDGATTHFDYADTNAGVRAVAAHRPCLGDLSRYDDAAALVAVERLLETIAPASDLPVPELLRRARAALAVDDDAIEHLDVDVLFADGSELQASQRETLWQAWERQSGLSGLLQ